MPQTRVKAQCCKKQPNSYSLKRYLAANLYPQICRTFSHWIGNRLNPFNLCPRTVLFWYFIPPYSALGISILGLEEIAVYGRQQIEPNETTYLMFKILELRIPFPLTLFIMFLSLALVLTDGAYRVLQAVRSEYEDTTPKQSQNDGSPNQLPVNEYIPSFDPYSLTPRMSIYFPFVNDHTSIGFLTIDLRHVEVSIKQSLEPNANIKSLIRFIDVYCPYPLQILIMIFAFGLFLCGLIYRYGLDKTDELLNTVRKVFADSPEQTIIH